MQVIATAGHVDHGKSTLVRALTGMEPDRWAEERRRGLTIDLGFAWLTLPSGQQVAFVDVPGHERFVPNMLAGVGAVPAVLFTVAADEGWMPQSEEHLAAVDALGITHGLLVITRADLADPSAALREARDRIAATSLGAVEAVSVSARTGEGMTGLTGALERLARPPPRARPRRAGAAVGGPVVQYPGQRNRADRDTARRHHQRAAGTAARAGRRAGAGARHRNAQAAWPPGSAGWPGWR